MNERIKQLAEQAGLISAEYNGFDSMYLNSAQRKFAVLIIKECANYIKEHYPHSFYEAEYMQRHFGVNNERTN